VLGAPEGVVNEPDTRQPRKLILVEDRRAVLSNVGNSIVNSQRIARLAVKSASTFHSSYVSDTILGEFMAHHFATTLHLVLRPSTRLSLSLRP